MMEVPCMYRMKPVCGLQARVELPKCMYRLRQIQGSFDVTEVSYDSIISKTSVIEEQVKILLKDKLPAVTKLEQRQEIILSQLRNLKCLVEELCRQLRVPPTTPLEKAGTLCMKKSFQEATPRDVLQLVVKASPSRLPHALLAIIQHSYNGLGDVCKVKPGCITVKWYSHSTTSGPSPSLHLSNDYKLKPSIHISFIWKDAVKVMEFSIGNSQVWLKGEPLLMRVILHHLSNTSKECVVTDVALASLLDSCAAISDLTENSSSSSLKQTLSEANRWFSCLDLIPSKSHSMSVGEISLWGALKGLSLLNNNGCLPQETPGKLNDWFTSYSKFMVS